MEFEKQFSEGFIKDIEELIAKGAKNATVILDYENELLEVDLSFRIRPKEKSEDDNGNVD